MQYAPRVLHFSAFHLQNKLEIRMRSKVPRAANV